MLIFEAQIWSQFAFAHKIFINSASLFPVLLIWCYKALFIMYFQKWDTMSLSVHSSTKKFHCFAFFAFRVENIRPLFINLGLTEFFFLMYVQDMGFRFVRLILSQAVMMLKIVSRTNLMEALSVCIFLWSISWKHYLKKRRKTKAPFLTEKNQLRYVWCDDQFSI